MATSTPTTLSPPVIGPVRSLGLSDTRCVIRFTLGVYATAGAVLTLPTDEVKGLDLKGVNILTPISPTGAIRYYSWDGSVSAPKVYATVAATGAQVTDTTDLSAVELVAELIYGG